nr:serine hydrolase-like protein [Procambarus clarkii]XP_045599421.1 serine hydrolase-like protein [Procambarus clarkii]XP_045599422.1 serine hydrolase-like protein [Procambarus clarkii]
MREAGLRWREVTVEVGWGVVRGKTCVVGGSASGDGLKIFCLHGWLDNANTFDTLAPLLPSGVELLAIDLPGHGLSDHLPPGMHYSALTDLINIRLVAKKLGWYKFVFLAHSMGALIANYYTAMFPEDIIALIQLDYIIPRHNQDRITTWRAEVNIVTKAEANEKVRPLYTKKEALQRLVNARKSGPNNEEENIDEAAAEILLPRSAIRIGDEYRWRHDSKVYARFTMLYGMDNWHFVVTRITCPVLLLRASNGICNSLLEPVYRKVLDGYSSSSRLFQYSCVDGAHHVHLTHPERVAPLVKHFLNNVVASPRHAMSPKL